jgi:hypothetical protein
VILPTALARGVSRPAFRGPSEAGGSTKFRASPRIATSTLTARDGHHGPRGPSKPLAPWCDDACWERHAS